MGLLFLSTGVGTVIINNYTSIIFSKSLVQYKPIFSEVYLPNRF